MSTTLQINSSAASKTTAESNLNDNDPSVLIDGKRFYEIVGELCEVADKGLQRSDYYNRCFNLLCEYLNAQVGLINLRLGPRTLEREYSTGHAHSKTWLQTVDSLVLRAQTDETALATIYRSQCGTTIAYAIAAPILSANRRPFGAIAMVIPGANGAHSESDLIQLSQLIELIVENAPKPVSQPKPGKEDDSKALQSVVRASDYRSIEQLCFAIVNSLCSKLRCEQIAIGMVRRRDIKLIAVSGLSEVPKSTPGMMAVQQAMAVCFDRNETTVVQEPGRLIDQIDSSTCKVHEIWHRATGGSSVATIPLCIDGDCIAVIAVRRQANHPFTPEDIKRARVLSESFAPALPLVNKASRTVLRHIIESTTCAVHRLFSWQGMGRKAAAILIMATMAWMLFGKMDYRVLAPCRIVPEQVSTIAAPFEGMIEEVIVLPGQKVVAGQVLARLDTEDLEIERRRILSEIASTRIEANALLQQRKPEESFQLQAQVQVLETDLKLVTEQIARAEVRAISDGVVLPTDIHRRVGQYVQLGEPLLEVANEAEWHLEIETPESEARHLSIDQMAHFQTNARPDTLLACRVTKISPSSEVLRQKNVVVAEAVLNSREEWMKLGMEGHVKIETGKQPVWWVFLHPALDYARLKLWL